MQARQLGFVPGHDGVKMAHELDDELFALAHQ
jgi:hypothetical protein